MPQENTGIKTTKDNNANSVQRSEYILQLVNNWISNIDTKVSVSCGLFTVVFSIITIIINEMISDFGFNILYADNPLPVGCRIILLLSVVAFTGSFFLHLLAIFPSLFGKTKKKTGCDSEIDTRKSIVFFENISKFKGKEEYVSNAISTTDMEYCEDLFTEVFYNSVICTKKIIRFRWALVTGALSVIGGLLACIYISSLPF